MKRIGGFLLCFVVMSSSVLVMAGTNQFVETSSVDNYPLMIPPNTSTAVNLTDPILVTGTSTQKLSVDICAADNGRIYAVWDENSGPDYDIFLSYSSNNGTTFTDPIRVNTNTSGHQMNPSVDVNSAGTVFVTWKDMGTDAGDIVLARSVNGGNSFSPEVRVNSYQPGAQAHPSLAVNGADVAVVWEGDSGSDCNIRLWNAENGALVRELEGHTNAVLDMEFSPYGTFLASGAEDNLVKIWDTTTWACTNLTDHSSQVTSVNWSSDSSMLVTGSWDYNVTIWDTSDYSIITRLNQINNGTADVQLMNPVNAAGFSPDATSTSGQVAVAYNGELEGMPTGVPNIMFNITVWNLTDHSNWTVKEDTGGHTSSVTDIAFSYNGTFIVSSSKDNKVMVWNASSSVKFMEVNLGRDVLSVCWSPDDTQIAAGLSNGTIVVFNFSDPSTKYWLEQHTGQANAISWNTVRNEIVSGASDPRAKAWNLTSKTERLNLSGHNNSVYSVDWTPNGDRIATAGGNSIQYKMGENQIYCAVSDDSGQTFSTQTMISDTCAKTRRRPRVDMDSGSNISVVWYDFRNVVENIYFANSTDKGVTFFTNIAVSETGKVENIPDIAVERDTGKVHVVWQYDEGTSIHYANSSDGFQNNIELAASGQMPSIATSPDGSTTWATWRFKNSTTNFTYFQTDISYDHGATFNDLTDIFNGSYSASAISIDCFDQASIVWLTTGPDWEVYHVSSVVPDTWKPIVTGTIPAHLADNVSILTSIQVNFSEPMDNISVEDTFSITDGGTVINRSGCEIVWNGYGNKVTFTPKSPLNLNTLYTVTIGNSSNDISGNDMLVNHTFSFTTQPDTTPPSSSVYPISPYWHNTSPIIINVMASDTGGAVANVTLWYRHSPNNSTWSANKSFGLDASAPWNWTFDFPDGEGYYGFYSIAKDTANNTEAAPASADAICAYDITPPDITDSSPSSGTTGDSCTFQAEVTDNLSLDEVHVIYWFGTGTETNVTMAHTTGDNYELGINMPHSTETLHYLIVAVDYAGSWNSIAVKDVIVTDNDVPVADAGPDQTVAEGTIVTFDGSGSNDNIGIANYTWTFIDGFQDVTLYGVAPSHNFTVIGNYIVTLTVFDAGVNNDTVTMIVTVLIDTDGDGIPDETDSDDDDDGVPDGEDDFPTDPDEDTDTDGDGIGDNADDDDDNDGYLDEWENFLGTDPLNQNDNPVDTDDDGIPDGDANNTQPWMDTDDDDDGVLDSDDPAPFDPEVTGKGGLGEYWWTLLIIIIVLLIVALVGYKMKGGKSLSFEGAVEEEEEIEPPQSV